MRILNLKTLRVGDVVLETGDPRIARATGGPFGHASLVLGSLLRVEAGKDEGVEFNPFPLVAYRQQSERVVGMPISHDQNVCVLRRREPLDEGTTIGEALWEGGRRYSVSKLLELKDLKPAVRQRLAEHVGAAADDGSDGDARFCSEVVARVLRLPETNVSPNALQDASQLEKVADAIVDVEGWTEERTRTADNALHEMVVNIELDVAAQLAEDVYRSALRIRRGLSSTGAEAQIIDAKYQQILKAQISTLREIRALEPTILMNEASPL